MNHTGQMRVTVDQAEKCIQQVQYVAEVVVAVVSGLRQDPDTGKLQNRP